MTAAYSTSGATVSDGTTSAVFTVKRSGTSADLAEAGSVDYSTQDITATEGTDYTATSGTLEFAAHVTEASVSVAIQSAAYDASTSRTFLFTLAGFGSATGTIEPSASNKTTQSYLYLPEDNSAVAVPTADSPGDNLKHQALYSGFSEPDSTTVDMPLAYIRLGYARKDVNDYERVILNSDSYHPKWLRYDGDTPVEPGTMQHMMLPRGVDRRDISQTQIDDLQTDNKHLDGLFLYSDANYSLTTKGHMTEVIQGDKVVHVEGSGRINYMDKLAQWVMDKGERSFRTANGVNRLNGVIAEYDIGFLKKFSVYADMQVNYNFGAKYNVNSAAELTLTNAATYDVKNSIGLEVTGYQIAATCDVLGNFSCKYFPGEIASTQTCIDQSASEKITLAIQTGVSSTWTAAVAAAANVNALSALSFSASAAGETFKSDSDFYKMATPDNLDTVYADAFNTDLPDTSAGLAGITAAIVAGACIAQKIADLAPSLMPKIEMDTTDLTLSVGDTSLIVNAAGVFIAGPLIAVNGADVQIEGDAAVNLTAPTIEAEAANMTVTGNLGVAEGFNVLGDAQVMGELYATLVEAA